MEIIFCKITKQIAQFERLIEEEKRLSESLQSNYDAMLTELRKSVLPQAYTSVASKFEHIWRMQSERDVASLKRAVAKISVGSSHEGVWQQTSKVVENSDARYLVLLYGQAQKVKQR
jgi:hypothetical protein